MIRLFAMALMGLQLWALKGVFSFVFATLVLQVVLGISTLLLHVPVALGVAHQGGAMLLFSATLFASHVQVRQ